MIATVVAVLAVVCQGAAAWLVLGTPGDAVFMQSPGGMPWSEGRRVVVWGEFNPTELRPGDEVLAVEDRGIHAWADDLVRRPVAARPWRPGQTVIYRVRRDGMPREIAVPIRRSLGSVRGAPWPDIAAKVLALLLTGFVFLRRPRVPAARAGLVAAAGWTLQLSFPAFSLQVHPVLGPIGAIPYLLWIVGVLLWPAALLHFALAFPEPQPSARRAWLVGLAYGLPLGMLGAYLVLVAGGAPTTGFRAVLWQAIVQLVRGFPLVVALAFWWGYLSARDPLARERMRWVAVTFACAMVLYAGLFTLPWWLFHRALAPGFLQPLLGLACLVALAVAILRYRAFDLEVLVNRTLVWGGLTACVAAVYGGTLLLLGLLLERQSQPRFVLTLAMPGLGGVEATRQLVRTTPQVGVLVLTMHDEDDAVFAAMRAGARGYVLKGASQQELVHAIHAVARGEAIFGPQVATRVLDWFAGRTPKPAEPFPELTNREREVLGLIAQGHNNTVIAQRLHLAPKTVRNLASSVFAKLQVADRAQAMRRALDEGLGG